MLRENFSRAGLVSVTLIVAYGLLAFAAGCSGEGATVDSAGATASTAQFANTKCPIMGTKIDPTKVSETLVREFDGKKIAFCCGGCPAAWDALSDEQKRAKLAEFAAK